MGIETTITCDVCGVSALGEREAFPARTYCPACDKKRNDAAEAVQLRETITRLQADVRILIQERDDARADNRNYRSDLDKSRADGGRLTTELVAARAETEQVKRERNRGANAYNDRVAELACAVGLDVATPYADLVRAVVTIRRERDAAQHEQAAACRSRDTAWKRVDEAAEQWKAKLAEAEKQRDAATEWANAAALASRDLSNDRAKRAEAEKERDENRARFDRLHAHTTNVEKELAATEKQRDEARAHRDRAEGQRDEAIKRANRLAESADKMTRERNTARALAELHKTPRYSEMEQMIERLGSKLAAAEKQRDNAIVRAQMAERERDQAVLERGATVEKLCASELQRDNAVEALKSAERERDEARNHRDRLREQHAVAWPAPPRRSDPLDGAIRRALEVALRERREMAETLTASQEAASALRLKLQAATETIATEDGRVQVALRERDGWKEAAERWERECKAAQKAGWDNLLSNCEMTAELRRQLGDACPECLAILRADPLRHFRGCSLRKPLPADHPQAETTQALAMLSEFAESCANEADRLGNGATAYAIRQYHISSWLIGYRSKQVKP